MSGVNAYFKLVFKDNSTYIRLFPHMNGGKSLSFDEISKYLDKHKINEYDKVELNRAVISGKECDVKVFSKEIIPENEDMKVLVSKDKLVAQMRFYMPSDGGKLLVKQDILDEISRCGIKYGIVEHAIDSFLENRKYCTPYTIAKGKAAVDGHDALIAYTFKTDKSLKPRMNEDGSVDFHSLDNINNVSVGDILATLSPMDPGTEGSDIYGKMLPPKKVNNLSFKHGKNIHISEDGLSLITDVQGHVELSDGSVFVSDTYEVPDSVNTTTGDIEYSGNVHVPGSVMTGFTIKAKGDVIVDGVVECATIISGGNIILARGIQGQRKGLLSAKGDIVSKFIESAIVRSGGNVHTESIIYSDVSAKGDVVVTGKKGNIVGGITRAISSIECKTVGSPMETKTELEVGIDPALTEELKKLEKEIVKYQENLEKTEQIIELFKKKVGSGEKLSADKIKVFKTATESYKEMTSAIQLSAARYSEIKDEISSLDSGKIIASGVAHMGVKISISNTVYYIRNETNHVQFIKDQGEIKEMLI